MKQISDAHWIELVADYKASGKSLTTWCKDKNIPITTYIYWRRMHRMRNYAPVQSPNGACHCFDIFQCLMSQD